MRPSVRFVGVCPARVAARPARRHEPRYGVRRCDRPIQPCPCLSGELFPAPAQDRPDPIQVVVLAAVVSVNLLLDTTPDLTFGRPQLYGIPHTGRPSFRDGDSITIRHAPCWPCLETPTTWNRSSRPAGHTRAVTRIRACTSHLHRLKTTSTSSEEQFGRSRSLGGLDLSQPNSPPRVAQ